MTGCNLSLTAAATVFSHRIPWTWNIGAVLSVSMIFMLESCKDSYNRSYTAKNMQWFFILRLWSGKLIIMFLKLLRQDGLENVCANVYINWCLAFFKCSVLDNLQDNDKLLLQKCLCQHPSIYWFQSFSFLVMMDIQIMCEFLLKETAWWRNAHEQLRV